MARHFHRRMLQSCLNSKATGWRLMVWLLPVLGLLWTVWRAPDWLEPRSVDIRLSPGQELVLGKVAFSAPWAEPEQVLLRRETTGGWRLSDLSATNPVRWQPRWSSEYRVLRQWLLQPGQIFRVGKHVLTVVAATRDRLTLREGERIWVYDGLDLHSAGTALPTCWPRWHEPIRQWLGDSTPLGLVARRPLRLGGGVYCADRLGLSEIPLDTAEIQPTSEGFSLRLGSGRQPDGSTIIVAAGTAEAITPLAQQTILLETGHRLLMGRTRYQVLDAGAVLSLAPIARAQRRLADSPPPKLPAEVAINWDQPVWLWPAQPLPQAGGLAGLLALLAWLGGSGRWRRLHPAGSVAGRIGLGLILTGTCLALHWHVLTVPLLWPYIVGWPALLVWLLTVRSPWSVGLLSVLTLLLGGGLIALLQLGTGAQETGWQRFGGSGAALAGAFGWLTWVGWTVRRDLRWAVRLNERQTSWLLGLLCAATLGLLIAQVLLGNESGWAGWQPFQLGWLALTLTAAWAFTQRSHSTLHGWSYAPAAPWLHYLGPLVLLVVTCAFILLFLRDFSPLLLLAFWGMALLWAYLQTHPLPAWRWGGQAMIGVLVLALSLALTGLQNQPEAITLPFQMDRLRVWAAPEQYPHAGYQLRRALEAIRAGEWRGTVWSEATNGRAMGIPVVASDFVPAFFLSRYGGLAGLLLVGLQALLLVLLILIAGRAWRRGQRPSDGLPLFGSFIYFTLYGGAALLGGHFLISWGTNLGFLPIMGQPMSLLSAAGSHLVFFVLPIIALAIAAEEKNRAEHTC